MVKPQQRARLWLKQIIFQVHVALFQPELARAHMEVPECDVCKRIPP